MVSKISLLILCIALQGYASAILPASYDDEPAQSAPAMMDSKPKPDLGQMKQDMAKGMENLDAEWLKRDAIKNLMEQDSTNPMIGSLENISADDFKNNMIEGVKQLDDDSFVQMLQKDNILDKDGYFNQDVLKQQEEKAEAPPNYGFEPRNRIEMEELQKRLSEEQFHTTQYSIQEKEGSGKYVDHEEEGKFSCVGCYTSLFSSKHKYKSKRGYAAFNKAIGDIHELSFGAFTEAKCENCGAYLGDVAKDADSGTDKGYLINSGSINFEAGVQYVD